METAPLDAITREEFDRRLDELNARQRHQLEHVEEEQSKVEQLLTHYETILDEIEAELTVMDALSASTILLRKRLYDLAGKTAEVAAIL